MSRKQDFFSQGTGSPAAQRSDPHESLEQHEGPTNQRLARLWAATATKAAIPALTRKSGEADAGETFNTKLSNRTTIIEQFSLFPNLSDTGDYRFQFDTTAATKLKNWLSWQVTYSDRYLSDPLPGFTKNDLILSTGVRLTFGKGVF
ncbi:MAG TPA: DUF481 domain-containing protein [Candidatus Acidoferrum sp.]|nr:DUF481 domain-containing protein [Candidatus Acidoferrum sp.]